MKGQQYLFDPNKYSPRKTASESEFQEQLSEFLPEFFHAFEYAFEKMCAERTSLRANEINSRWPANAINRYVYSWLTDNPKTLPFIKKQSNTFYFEYGQYKLTFKKVDNNYRPSYIATEQSQMLERNLTSSDEDTLSVIFIGYQVDDTWSQLKGAYALSRNGDQLKWRIDLDNLESSHNANSQNLRTLDLFSEKTPVSEPEVTLKVKCKDEDNKALDLFLERTLVSEPEVKLKVKRKDKDSKVV